MMMRVLLISSLLVTSTIATNPFRQQSFPTPAVDPLLHARDLLTRYPLIDSHVDTPQVMRVLSKRPLDIVDSIGTGLPGHFDLPRAKEGGLGGVFFTVWAPCAEQVGVDLGPDFQNPDNTLRDTIESIDLIHAIIDRHDILQYSDSADKVEQSFAQGKIAALIGMEGSHMLGNSLSTIRMLAKLGVRYLTLTHVCHSAFASSAGGGAGTDGSYRPPVHKGNALTHLGRELVRELNRLGVMVDLSHVTDGVMHEVLDMTEVPVVFTHSGARAIHDHPRNVPDEVLDKIGPGKNDGVIQSVLYPIFIDPNNATIAKVADHVEHIAMKTSRANVGLASDFDGMNDVVEGMEDASKWPYLVAEFIRRGWSDEDIKGLLGGNLLRVMRAVEAAKETRSDELPNPAIYDKRIDLPASNWGGPNGAYLPPPVKHIVDRRVRDEL